jgi:hypothetical protein
LEKVCFMESALDNRPSLYPVAGNGNGHGIMVLWAAAETPPASPFGADTPETLAESYVLGRINAKSYGLRSARLVLTEAVADIEARLAELAPDLLQRR